MIIYIDGHISRDDNHGQVYCNITGSVIWAFRSQVGRTGQGTGNNKSIYESNTGGMREGVLFCSFPLTPCYLPNSLSQATWSQSGHHSPAQLQMKGHRMKCTVITHILVFGKNKVGHILYLCVIFTHEQGWTVSLCSIITAASHIKCLLWTGQGQEICYILNVSVSLSSASSTSLSCSLNHCSCCTFLGIIVAGSW